MNQSQGMVQAPWQKETVVNECPHKQLQLAQVVLTREQLESLGSYSETIITCSNISEAIEKKEGCRCSSDNCLVVSSFVMVDIF